MEYYSERQSSTVLTKEFQEITLELSTKPTNLSVNLRHYGVETFYTFPNELITKLAMHCPSAKIVEFIVLLKQFCLVKCNANDLTMRNFSPKDLSKNLYNRFKSRYKNLGFDTKLKSKHIKSHLYLTNDLLLFHNVFSHFIQKTSLETIPHVALTADTLKEFGIFDLRELSMVFQIMFNPNNKQNMGKQLCKLELAIETNQKNIKDLLNIIFSFQNYTDPPEERFLQSNQNNAGLYSPHLDTYSNVTLQSSSNSNNNNNNQQNSFTNTFSPVFSTEMHPPVYRQSNEHSETPMRSLQELQITPNLLEQPPHKEFSTLAPSMQNINANSIEVKISAEERLHQARLALEKNDIYIASLTRLFNNLQNHIYQLQAKIKQMDQQMVAQPTHQEISVGSPNKKLKTERSCQQQPIQPSLQQNQQTMNTGSTKFFPTPQTTPSSQQGGATPIKPYKPL